MKSPQRPPANALIDYHGFAGHVAAVGALRESMPAKIAPSALNLSTFVSLHAYGYRNVYELGPALDVNRSRLAFAGQEAGR